ncbi:MAG: ROK family protein, partial [Spirochaetota bacterium]
MDLCAVDADGNTVCRGKLPLTGEELQSPTGRLSGALAAGFKRFVRENGLDTEKIAVYGVVLPGVIDYEKGMAVLPEGKSTVRIGLREKLREVLKTPVIVEDPARSLAYLAYKGGIERAENFIYLYGDREVGCGVVINGSLYRGQSGLAGKIGHIQVEPDGSPCRCGGQGCLDTVASAEALVRGARDLAGNGGWALGLELSGGDPGGISLQTLRDAVDRDDATARGLVERVAGYLGEALLLLLYTYNPELVLVGGALTGLGPYLMTSIQRYIDQQSPVSVRNMLRLVPCEFAEGIDSVGAAVQAFDHLFEVGRDDEPPPSTPVTGSFVTDLICSVLPRQH